MRITLREQQSIPDDADAEIRDLLLNIVPVILKGCGSQLKPEDVDPNELRMGIEVEMEHVCNTTLPDYAKEAIATLIALDHLDECETYYTRLKEIENQCEEK